MNEPKIGDKVYTSGFSGINQFLYINERPITAIIQNEHGLTYRVDGQELNKFQFSMTFEEAKKKAQDRIKEQYEKNLELIEDEGNVDRR